MSTETVYCPVAQLPAGSHDGLDVTTWFPPSADTVVGGGVVAGPDEGAGSELDQVIVTGALYQPLALAARSGLPVTTGALVSGRLDR